MRKITKYETADGQVFDTEAAAARHEASNFKLPPLYVNATRIWAVTTEGDVEGRSTRNIGLYVGHLADIAAHAADQACYSLAFKALDPKPVKHSPGVPGKPTITDHGVDVSLCISSNTWDLTPEQRAVVFQKHYGNDQYEFVRGNTYASAKMKKRK